jgi:dTMP kinase
MFIVLEGIDASGKKTQIGLLNKRLKKEGFKPEVLDFPTYDSPIGKLIASNLRGDLKTKHPVSPELASIMYAADRYQYKDKMFNDLKKGKILIANRYMQSNIGFQGAHFSGEARNAFINWLYETEARLPQADIVVFLDMPAEMAKRLRGRRPRKRYLKPGQEDIHERSLEYQKKVRDTYLEVAKKEGWILVGCCNGRILKKPQKIHEEIWDKIKNKL